MATAVACGGGAAPELAPIQDRQVQVGSELVVELIATDADGDELYFDYATDVPDIGQRASLTKNPAGAGIFRWRPLAADVGTWYFDFTVTDGSSSDTVTIEVEVKSAVGLNGAPVFREPLGTGTTLDLRTRDCLEVSVVVEDQDSSSVILAQEEPLIDGATLSSTGGLTGRWSWCPSAAQIADDDRYMLVLSADDLNHPKTQKNYLVVLRRESKPDCPGTGPVITHAPADESTVVALTIDAHIADDKGLKREPLFYYSLTPPSDPVDLSAMTQLTMVLIDGTMSSGTWAADVPNPVAGKPQGASATLYYVIVAQDDDDADGDCDHIVQAPVSGAYQMTVTNPGGAGGAALCSTCSADLQCGGASDLCVRVGAQNEPFCLRSCTSSSDCPTDYTCSTSALSSVDGASGKQCVPVSNSCADPGGAICMDDSFEDNDSRSQASIAPGLPVGTHELVSCPAQSGSGSDEDWFPIDLGTDATVTISIDGGNASDLDLALYDINGNYITSSVSLTSKESITRCLTAGSYYIRVYAWGAKQNAYTLTYARTNGSCNPAPACQDDPHEPDDSHTTARATNVYPNPFVTETNAICAGDDDWFAVDLYNGETVYVDLTFTQTTSKEDLDLHFYDSTPTSLTPCSESSPLTCSAAQGQSATSNEHYEYTVQNTLCSTTPCRFYVVVRGWSGSENLYDLRIGLTPK